MTRLWILTIFLVAACALMGCDDASDDTDTQPQQDTQGGDLAEDSGEKRGDYPSGPYGVAENDTLENHVFVAIGGGDFSLEEIYQDSSRKLLLISTAADWCTSCLEEQPKLQALYEEHQSKGLDVLVTVFEDANFLPADESIAANWKEKNDLTYHVVADPTFIMSAYYDEEFTPMNMIVDVASMEILWITTGWDQGTVEAIINSKL